MQNTFFSHITKPGRYLGSEYNSIEKEWNSGEVRFALIFPDLYEIGMSHLGLQILYHILNREEKVIAERCFCPDLDAEKIMRTKNIPPMSLESGQPLSRFDVLGITLPYELCYTNILTILDLAGIPFYSHERDDSHPLLLGGGSCSLNPEPVAAFFDAILLGDGEEAIVEIAECLRRAKKDSLGREEILLQLGNIQGVYIPAAFQPEYDTDQKLRAIHAASPWPDRITRRIVRDLDQVSHLYRPIVPNAKIVHDRLGIEIARGCTRGCRFCQAGMTYRPVRERTPEQIMDIAGVGIAHSGFEELALLSLSTGDYSCIEQLLPRLMDTFASSFVSVSMPSMRVGTLSQSVMNQIKRVRKTGFTIAPEAGSERLRQVINKGITEEDLLTTCLDAFSLGWSTIKLYFMIGLPTETMEDVEAIADLALKTKKEGNKSGDGRRQITVSVGTFVPKPHTPFQWERQLSLEESRERIFHLKKMIPRGCKMRWHDPAMSFLEGVFSRGDRRLAALIVEAWQQGARLDGWSDHFDLSLWQKAAESRQLDMTTYLRAREHNEVLPWQHLSSGVDTRFFLDELEKAHTGTYTPDCRYHGCQQCGLCDFETLQPIVHNRNKEQHPDNQEAVHAAPRTTGGNDSHFKYMVRYSRRGNICYLGHLEILQLLFRSLRRAGIQTNFSQGFNPTPKISFSGALPVGVESLAEFFIMDLPEPLKNTEETRNLLNQCLPPGLLAEDIRLHSGKVPQSVLNTYTIYLPRPLTEDEIEKIAAFQGAQRFPISRQRKGKTREIDIRSRIVSLERMDNDTLTMGIVATAGDAGIKAGEALFHILAWDEDLLAGTGILKTAWEELTAAER